MQTMRRFVIRNKQHVSRRRFSTILACLLALFILSLAVLPHRRRRRKTEVVLARKEPPRLQFIYKETKFNGLGSQALRLVDAYALADVSNASLCINEGRYWNYGCGAHRGWSCYFTSFQAPERSQDSCKIREECEELSEMDKSSQWNKKCVIISSKSSYGYTATALQQLQSGQLERSRKLATEMWQLNERMRKAVQQVVDEVGLTEPYVALHVRRGDKKKERPFVPLKRYADAVKLLANDNSSVFVATDDGSVLAELRYYLRGRAVVTVKEAKSRKGHVQAVMNRLYLRKNVGRVVTLLAEIEIMRRASLFVCTFSSNLGRLVHVLRWQRADSSVSLDDRWACGVAWRTFGQDYCGSQDANQVYCNNMKDNKNQ